MPTIVQSKLARCLSREVSEDAADETIAFSTRCVVASLSTELALQAAEIAKDHGLAMADAIIYATTVAAGADLLTCDPHFAKLPQVVYVAKGPQ